MQEFNAAKEAILSAIPTAVVKGQVNSNYPITVRVVTQNNNSTNNAFKNSKETEIWSGSQKKLFRKYADARRDSQRQIKQAVLKHCE